MKIVLKTLLTCSLSLLICIAALTSCGDDGASDNLTDVPDNTHNLTQAPGHTHTFGNWSVSKEATCSEDGLETRSCTCGYQESKTVSSKGHTAGDWVVVKEPTLSEDGQKEQKCTVCNEKLAEEAISSLASKGFKYTVNTDGVTCSITGIGECKDKDVIIPEYIDGYRVTAIKEYGLQKGTFDTIQISSSITFIGRLAFYDCDNLTSIVIPEGVTTIEDNIFEMCDSLTSVELPTTLRYVSQDSLPDFMKKEENGAVYFGTKENPYLILDNVKDKNISSFKVNENTKIIAEAVFREFTNLKTVTLPKGLRALGEECFRDSGITSITIPGSVKEIGYQTFDACRNLTKVTVEQGVEALGREAFSACTSLTDIVLPESVTSIGLYSFSSCSALKSITLPNSVTHIEGRAFEGCNNLTGKVENGAVYLGNATNPYLVLFNVKDEKITSFTINPKTKFIENAFSDCQYLESITIPNGVISIGGKAFLSCDALTSVIIPDGVTYIGYNAFYSCENLTSITIPSSVTEINPTAFDNSELLKTVNFKGTMEEWNAIYTSKYWPKDAKIICSDGTITNS